ncbi:MAG TPA: cohesin domain-containing protein [Patescibacteria group bacterium]|nr:cohesin domain-containing protein [Patescibacteria group bacterium]
MSKKTLALLASLIVLTAVLLALALRPENPQAPFPSTTQNQTTDLTPSPQGHTTLALTPNPLIAQSGTSTVSVEIDTGGDEVTAVQLEIEYDPQVLSNVKVARGQFMENSFELLNAVDQQKGQITYALGITPAQAGVKGKGIVATISFTPLRRTGQTVLTFLPTTLVTASGITQTVLRDSSSTTVILGTASLNSQAVATPSSQ